MSERVSDIFLTDFVQIANINLESRKSEIAAFFNNLKSTVQNLPHDETENTNGSIKALRVFTMCANMKRGQIAFFVDPTGKIFGFEIKDTVAV